MAILAIRSILVLGLLFAMVFAIATAALYSLDAPLWFALVVAGVVMFLQYLISPWIIQLILKIQWLKPGEMPEFIENALEGLSQRHRMRTPRFGIIPDGNPNAFTFGHYPGNARIVVTQGLLDMCDEGEITAVLSHEFGHVAHWDFAVMTIAATLVMMLYYIYVFGRSSRDRRRNGRRDGSGAALVALGAYIAYIIGEYLVLFLSRTREYYADQYAAEVTNNPNGLSSALVKIAYGLARSGAAAGVATSAGASQNTEGSYKNSEARLSPMHGFRTMGIFDPKMGASMTLAAAGSYGSKAGGYDTSVMVKAMEWDLFNPWSWICELSSSHPLPAKRIRALTKYARARGQYSPFEFPEHAQESYWDEFFTDLLIYYLPLIGLIIAGAAGFALSSGSLEQGRLLIIGGAATMGLGAGLLIRVMFMYPSSRFERDTVANLVSQVKVSAIRCVLAELEGKVIGRGIPGLYWSEDLVIEDDTGFMVLDYRQPIGVLNFLFGLFRAEQFVGQSIRVIGWYRRFPKPFLEVWKIYTPDGAVNTCWTWWLRQVSAVVVLVLGIGLMLAGLLLAA
ncbi:MAG: M48 family metalloprotease [Armatimonadota bacterium]